MIYYSGVLCVFLAIASMGFLRAQRIESCRCYREQWLNNILSLEGSIRYGATPLCQVFGELVSDVNSQNPVDTFCWQMASSLEEYQEDNRAYSFLNLWKEKLKLLDPLNLNRTDLMQLGMHLGNCDLQTQTNYLQRYRVQLERQICAEDTDLKRKQKLVQVLYTALGMVVVLMMI